MIVISQIANQKIITIWNLLCNRMINAKYLNYSLMTMTIMTMKMEHYQIILNGINLKMNRNITKGKTGKTSSLIHLKMINLKISKETNLQKNCSIINSCLKWSILNLSMMSKYLSYTKEIINIMNSIINLPVISSLKTWNKNKLYTMYLIPW